MTTAGTTAATRAPRRPGRPNPARWACRPSGPGAVLALVIALLVGGCSAPAGARAGDSPAPTGSAAVPGTSPAVPRSPVASGSHTSAQPHDSSAAPAPPTATRPTPTSSLAGLPVDGSDVIGTKVSVRTLTLDGIVRTWVTYAPPGGTAGLPLLVFLHGTDATVNAEASRDKLLQLVAAGRLTMIYPVGYDQNWDAGKGCCGEAAAEGLHDVQFVRELTNHAITLLKPDRRRVYLGGYSAGGKVGWELVCADPGVFAALATFGANPTSPCPHTGARLPVLIGFGALDRAEPLAGEKTDLRGPHPPAIINLRAWLARDGCPAASTTVHQVDVTVQTWSCADGTTVVYDLWPKARHIWPAPPATTLAQSAGRVLWAFLASRRLPDTGGAASRDTS